METRWWFQTFMFTPWGMIQFHEYVANGLKPPTSFCIGMQELLLLAEDFH